MNPWFETIGIVIIAVLGVFLGKVFSRLRWPYWTLGYFLPLSLVVILMAPRFVGSLSFTPPFYWILLGRTKFAVLAVAITMGLTTPLAHLSGRSKRLVICVLMAVFVAVFSVLPLLATAFVRGRLSNLDTRLDPDGICLQSTGYTCGPAAAVTALRSLGLRADEGEIAVLSHTNPVTGTLPVCLCSAIQARYGPGGLICRYRRFDSVLQLRNVGVTLAVVRDAFLSDHCVAVVDVSDDTVTVADPVVGRVSMSPEQFEKIWRFSGIVLGRDSAQNI